MILTIGATYKRTFLHQTFGGQRQGGISTPTAHPIVMIFTGSTGHQYGYADGFQPDGMFWYTGEGQVGDMQFVRGNAAIRDAGKRARKILLFEEARRSWVRFIGEVRCIGWHEAVTPDKEGTLRRAIVFELALDPLPDGAPEVEDPPSPDLRDGGEQQDELVGATLDELRQRALQNVPANATPAQRQVNVRVRSAAVRRYVLRRADGRCEGCGAKAPFFRKDGSAYLEPHHILRRADNGPDHPRWVIALCPNCHRRVHSGADGHLYNQQLSELAAQAEAEAGFAPSLA